MNSPRNHDGHSSAGSHRLGSTRRPISSSRHTASTKPSSTYLKPGDKHGSSSNAQPRYVLFLDKARMPTFYDKTNTRVPFSNTELEVWLRRLRILYQIDKGRYYGDVIDHILSILQFVSADLLCPLARITPETYATDEVMLNDIARARMHFLEEWASDGNAHRQVNLTKGYKTLSPSALVNTPPPPIISEKPSENADYLFQATVISSTAAVDPFDTNSTDTDD